MQCRLRVASREGWKNDGLVRLHMAGMVKAAETGPVAIFGGNGAMTVMKLESHQKRIVGLDDWLSPQIFAQQ